MKKLFIILTLLILIMACKKENTNEDKFLTFIKAGQTDGIGINYVDFEPDKKLEYINDYDKHLILDLNKDSIFDFEVLYKAPPGRGSVVDRYTLFIPLGKNSVCVSTKETNWVESFTFGDTIDSYSNWSNSNAYLYTYHSWNTTGPDGNPLSSLSIGGYWKIDTNNYIGVKIITDDKELFGWVDVKMLGQIIRSYAVTVPY